MHLLRMRHMQARSGEHDNPARDILIRSASISRVITDPPALTMATRLQRDQSEAAVTLPGFSFGSCLALVIPAFDRPLPAGTGNGAVLAL